MRRALALAAATSATAALWASQAAAGTTQIGVRAIEFDLTFTSPPPFAPGPAELEYQNDGEDPHDLKIKRKGTRRVLSIAELAPQTVSPELDLRLKRGARYVMWCSTLDGAHRLAGMEATMRVRR
jgi:hypothetical protein